LHDKLRDRWDETSPLTWANPFRVRQDLARRNPNLVIGPIVSIVSISQFDDFGRRTFTVRDARGETAFPQGITEISPEYVKVQALTHMWESCVSTQSVPPAIVESILRKSIDPRKVDQRLRLVNSCAPSSGFPKRRTS